MFVQYRRLAYTDRTQRKRGERRVALWRSYHGGRQHTFAVITVPACLMRLCALLFPAQSPHISLTLCNLCSWPPPISPPPPTARRAALWSRRDRCITDRVAASCPGQSCGVLLPVCANLVNASIVCPAPRVSCQKSLESSDCVSGGGAATVCARGRGAGGCPGVSHGRHTFATSARVSLAGS